MKKSNDVQKLGGKPVPVKDKQENTFDYALKPEKRWEQRFPDKKCVMIPDPDKLDGRDRTEALQMRAKYYNLVINGVTLKYREVPLTEEEKVELMDTDMCQLFGVDRELYVKAKGLTKETPNEVVDTIF